jgi:integrase
MKRPTLHVYEYRHSDTHPYYLDLRPFGQGRKFFKTKAAAEAEALRQKTLHQKQSREAVGLQAHELSTFIDSKNKLGEYGKTIANAVEFYVDHLEQVRRCKTTVKELTTELIDSKRKDGRSEIYLRDLRNILGIFCRDFGLQPVGAVSSRELANWLRNVNGSPTTRANFRQNISVLFGYAVDEGMIDSNPVARVKKPKLVDKAPEIFSVDEIIALLNAANESASDVVPMLAIGAFAGLRESEIKRLDWREVNLQRGYIEVKAEKAKTAKRRIVRIQPNLTQWLAAYSAMSGTVVPANSRKKLEAVRKTAGLKRWSKNGLRHSFSSYRLAATNNAAEVAAELGHSTSQMLYSTYRELVAPEEAERYWKIVPAATDKVIAFAISNE